RTTAPTVFRSDLHRTKARSGTDRTSCRRRCICVSEPHRYLRARTTRVYGLWCASRRVSSDRTDRRGAAGQDRRARSGFAPSRSWCSETERRGLRGLRKTALVENLDRTVCLTVGAAQTRRRDGRLAKLTLVDIFNKICKSQRSPKRDFLKKL